ncbi:MAG: helix-turn-helix domain-containing protein [Candidatus Zixiibacteriota bacterium]|nr:MAG: helix-turn-helix domain-containing protein [candidate division Zixibacteria bacterium]
MNQGIQRKEFVSTGKAAELCSVTPDTVLKWIKSGKLAANRTPGGHYRIHRETLLEIIESGSLHAHIDTIKQPFQFCWEYYERNGGYEYECHECIVYRSRALRCYEMIQLPSESGHAKLHCHGACYDCEYYRVVKGQQLNVLLIAGQEDLKKEIESNASKADYNLQIAESEYRCSMIVENFRPDYVIIDCSIGKKECGNFTRHLYEDPRLPYVKIILVGDSHDIPSECNGLIFAVMKEPFTLFKLENLIGLAKLGKMAEA